MSYKCREDEQCAGGGTRGARQQSLPGSVFGPRECPKRSSDAGFCFVPGSMTPHGRVVPGIRSSLPMHVLSRADLIQSRDAVGKSLRAVVSSIVIGRILILTL